MKTFILHVASHISFSIGLIGIIIIVIGTLRGIYHYLWHLKEDNFQNIRYEIGSHLILGLDFLVAKDIIDTLLIDTQGTEKFWTDLISLITVVTIRIVLTYFIQKEIKDLKEK